MFVLLSFVTVAAVLEIFRPFFGCVSGALVHVEQQGQTIPRTVVKPHPETYNTLGYTPPETPTR